MQKDDINVKLRESEQHNASVYERHKNKQTKTYRLVARVYATVLAEVDLFAKGLCALIAFKWPLGAATASGAARVRVVVRVRAGH